MTIKRRWWSVIRSYLSRRIEDGRVIVHIAGIHSPGSRGVVHYPTHHLPALHSETGDTSFSLAVRCQLDGLNVAESEVLTGPLPW